MIRRIALSAILAVWSVGTAPGGEPGAERPPKSEVKVGLADRDGVTGVVTTLATDAVTIQPPGRPPERLAYIGYLAAGRSAPQIYYPAADGRPDLPPVMSVGLPSWYRYVPQDLKLGDIVTLLLDQRDGREKVSMICIKRRPGGKVPPAPGEVQWAGSHGGWAGLMNAEQDWDERRTPLPEWYSGRYKDDTLERSPYFRLKPQPARTR